MPYAIKVKTLNGVIIQENGIIRNSKGYLIGRTSGVDFNSEHINEDTKINKITTEQAMNHLSKALKEDQEYAYGWHANIAMMCNDAILSHDDQVDFAHKVGNDAASRFMGMCFDVETSLCMLLTDNLKLNKRD